MSAQNPNLIERILNWLRGGYPEGVPQHDYVALFGILRRSCTETEIEKLALELRQEGLLSTSQPEAEIRQRLKNYLHETPHEEDVRRVAARLAAGGWPLIQAPEPLVEAQRTLSQADGPSPLPEDGTSLPTGA